MSQHDYVIADQSHTAFRADLNLALAASVGLNSGATAPATTYAYMLWADTANALWKIRDSTNSSWLVIGPIAPTVALQRAFISVDMPKLVVTGSGGVLTIALKNASGSDASAVEPITLPFRNSTLATGDTTLLQITAAASQTLSNGSTLGVTTGPARVWFVLFNDAGTGRIGAVNCLNGSNVMALVNDALYSSTAEGGAGAADSAQTIYTGTAVTSKAMCILGYAEWTSLTAGTWTTPDKVQQYRPGVPLPGAVVQVQRNATGAVATGTTLIPFDDTIPQNTEGDQYMSQAITPRSAANVLAVSAQGSYSNTISSTDTMIQALFQDSTAGALACTAEAKGVSSGPVLLATTYAMKAGTTSATTFKIRAGQQTVGTTNFNGHNGTRIFGGVVSSFIEVLELMA